MCIDVCVHACSGPCVLMSSLLQFNVAFCCSVIFRNVGTSRIPQDTLLVFTIPCWSSGYLVPQDTLLVLRIPWWSSGYLFGPRDILLVLRISCWSSGYLVGPQDILLVLRIPCLGCFFFETKKPQHQNAITSALSGASQNLSLVHHYGILEVWSPCYAMGY